LLCAPIVRFDRGTRRTSTLPRPRPVAWFGVYRLWPGHRTYEIRLCRPVRRKG